MFVLARAVAMLGGLSSKRLPVNICTLTPIPLRPGRDEKMSRTARVEFPEIPGLIRHSPGR